MKVWLLRLLLIAMVIVVIAAVAVRTQWYAEDADGDGLPDCTEQAGLAIEGGASLGQTDATVADTDEDGVDDGYEVQLLATPTRVGGYPVWGWSCPSGEVTALADPADADTDGDLLGDAYEMSAGSNAFVGDTDGDGLSDGRERGWGSDPNALDTDGDGTPDGDDVGYGLTPVFVDERVAPEAWRDEFEQGLVRGEVEPEVDSVPQLLGALAGSSVSAVPVVGWFAGGLADARDTTANVIRGNWVAAASSASGVVPVIGDAARAAGLITRFLVKYPDRLNAVAKAIAGLDQVPVALRARLLKVVDAAALEQIQLQGLSEEQIVKLVSRGTAPKAIAQQIGLAAGVRTIEAIHADTAGFASVFSDAQQALRSRAQAVDGLDRVLDGPVYLDVPGADETGGRLVDVCTDCLPAPRPDISTLRVVKLGTQLWSETLQREVDKDAALGELGYVVEWHFYASRTGLVIDPPLLDALEAAGVDFFLHLPA